MTDTLSQRAVHDCVTIDEARAIAMDAADVGATKAICRTFGMLGVDLDDFDDMQRFRDDLHWVKSGRELSRSVTGKTISSIVGVVSIGLVIALYDWVKSIITHLK